MLYRAGAGNLRIAVTGDSLIMRSLRPYTEPDFLQVRESLRGCDVAFTNLEVVLGEEPDYPAEHCGGNWLGVEPGLVDDLTWLGFNLFSTANNHAGDFGAGGVLSTHAELYDRRITFAGTGETLQRARQPGYLEVDAGRVALIAVTTTWPPGSGAGQQRPDMIGRPGVNTLDHEVSYGISEEKMEMLHMIAEETGMADLRRRRIDYGYESKDEKDEMTFLDHRFVLDDPGIHTVPAERDMGEIVQWIEDARRQADFCFVSLHAHEGQYCLYSPAQFIETACREFIDAGADGVFGHGPHVLRGIEIYRGRPILYSLGNFLMQSCTMQRIPAELYRRYDVGELHGTPADVFDSREKKQHIRRDPTYWESAVVQLSYSDRRMNSVEVIPVQLGVNESRPQKGRPMVAHGEKARKILADLQDLSEVYGTTMTIDREVGRGYIHLQ